MPTKFWSPDDWQDAVNLWLTTRYPLGHYQKVPDKHIGDFGIEGFSTDGNCYQAHAPDALTTAQDLYEKQRNKITADVGKFYANGADLKKLFGKMKIHRWLLVVPSLDSALLVQHATAKTKEVKALKLSYVANDFRIGILEEVDFKAEQAKLLASGVHQLHIDVPDPSPQELSAWTKSNAKFLVIANDKLKDVLTKTKREKLVHQLARLYVRGETALQTLDANFPAVAGSARRIKAQREKTLEAESILADDAGTARLRNVIKGFEDYLFEEIPGISRNVAEQLAWEAAADWIFRCPMSF